MKILAIETSMGRTSVALKRPGEPMLAKRIPSGRGQAEQLIPLIGALMEEANLPFASLTRVAVCIGPGGFSGIRTGVAAARGIGLAARIPVVGATSFRIMAAAFEEMGSVPTTYALAAPAGMNAVYCQLVARGGKPLSEIVALPQSECESFFKGKAQVLSGPAAASLSEKGFVSLPIAAAELHPDAATLADIAANLDPERDAPSPYYVRDADARPQTKHVIALETD
ncbi:MAG: tRNA (adenosine(37)-N6)-threonylcarbamoyltransferase complex dimerization subunit type 1 TsaB [Rhodomicrobium sp.]